MIRRRETYDGDFLEKVKPEDRDILFRLLQYSLFEESAGDSNEMNGQALFEYPWFDSYFAKEGRDAYFIKEKGSSKLLGFAMVRASQKGHAIAEFMVIPGQRRNKIGKKAALECFGRYGGNWEVSPVQGSQATFEFWKYVIDEHTHGHNKFNDGTFYFAENDTDPLDL